MEHREPPRIVTGDHRFEEALEERRRPDPVSAHFRSCGSQRQIHYRRARALERGELGRGRSVLSRLQATRAALIGSIINPSINFRLSRSSWFRNRHLGFSAEGRSSSRVFGAMRASPRASRMLECASSNSAVISRNTPGYARSSRCSTATRQSASDFVIGSRLHTSSYLAADQMLLDETGTILNIKDADVVQPSQLSNLIRISGEGLVLRPIPNLGSSGNRGRLGVIMTNPTAEFWRRRSSPVFSAQPAQLADAERWPALRIMDINVTQFHQWGLVLETFEGAVIWWRDAPGDELPGRPTAEQKWAMLQRWRESSDHRPLPDGDYFAFRQRVQLSTTKVPRRIRSPSHVIEERTMQTRSTK